MTLEVRLQGVAGVLGDYGMGSRIQEMASRHEVRTVLKTETKGDFPGGPVGKNPPANAGDTDGFHPWSEKIPQATKACVPQLLRLHDATTEACVPGAHVPQ